MMFEKLKALSEKYSEINERLMQPETVNDPSLYRDLMKEYSSLTPLIEKYREYEAAEESLKEAEELRREETDREFLKVIDEQYETAKADISRLSEELKIMLLPKDPNDNRSVIMEIRAGAGGEEAALFAHSLMRMYTMKLWNT